METQGREHGSLVGDITNISKQKTLGNPSIAELTLRQQHAWHNSISSSQETPHAGQSNRADQRHMLPPHRVKRSHKLQASATQRESSIYLICVHQCVPVRPMLDSVPARRTPCIVPSVLCAAAVQKHPGGCCATHRPTSRRVGWQSKRPPLWPQKAASTNTYRALALHYHREPNMISPTVKPASLARVVVWHPDPAADGSTCLGCSVDGDCSLADAQRPFGFL